MKKNEERAEHDVRLLRTFETWWLVRDADRKIAWIRSNNVHQVELLEEETGFGGLACMLVTFKWCENMWSRQGATGGPSE